MALFAKEIPKDHRIAVIAEIDKADLFSALCERTVQLSGRIARHRHARHVALDVRQDHRHPGIRKSFGEDLQGDGLAGARGPRDKPVPVAVFQQQILRL